MNGVILTVYMKILKQYTYQWWEMGIFKASLLLVGIVIGAYWQEAFLPYITALLAAGIALGLYVMYVSVRQ